LTDSPLKKLIGKKLGPLEVEVDAERVRRFALSVQDTGKQEVPPTFLTLFRDLEFQFFNELGFPLSKVLHGDQEYAFDAPLKVGLRLKYETVLANLLEKKGKNYKLIFLVLETTFYTAGAESKRLALSKTTVVVREALE
jgi:hypothetical protein